MTMPANFPTNKIWLAGFAKGRANTRRLLANETESGAEHTAHNLRAAELENEAAKQEQKP